MGRPYYKLILGGHGQPPHRHSLHKYIHSSDKCCLIKLGGPGEEVEGGQVEGRHSVSLLALNSEERRTGKVCDNLNFLLLLCDLYGGSGTVACQSG